MLFLIRSIIQPIIPFSLALFFNLFVQIFICSFNHHKHFSRTLWSASPPTRSNWAASKRRTQDRWQQRKRENSRWRTVKNLIVPFLYRPFLKNCIGLSLRISCLKIFWGCPFKSYLSGIDTYSYFFKFPVLNYWYLIPFYEKILSGNLCCRPKPLGSVRTESDVCLNSTLFSWVRYCQGKGSLTTEHTVKLYSSLSVRPIQAGTRQAPSPFMWRRKPPDSNLKGYCSKIEQILIHIPTISWDCPFKNYFSLTLSWSFPFKWAEPGGGEEGGHLEQCEEVQYRAHHSHHSWWVHKQRGTWVTWVTWLLIFIGPGGSALKMLLASVASARNVASVYKVF